MVMFATKIENVCKVFNFSGQSDLKTWKLRDKFIEYGWTGYSNILVDVLPFSLQCIKELVNKFPFWQRRKKTGRPPIPEKNLLISYLVQMIFDTHFRQTEGLMKVLADFFEIEKVPGYSLLCKKNRSKRFKRIWERFHKFVLERFPDRKSVIATDGTGFSGRKRRWNETSHPQRAVENWVKVHAAVEVDSFLILSFELTDSNVHESQKFEDVWKCLPDNIKPVRSLADSAYTSDACIRVAKKHGATAFHDVKKNAIHERYPKTAYRKLVNFATHWPNRYKSLKAKRSHAETAFSMIEHHFNGRLRCRTKLARENEVRAKLISHNLRLLAIQGVLGGK